MNKHYFARLRVRNRETGVVEDKTFDVWAYEDWHPAWRGTYGADWKLIDVVEIREAYADEVLA